MEQTSSTVVRHPGGRREPSPSATPTQASSPWSCIRTALACCANWFIAPNVQVIAADARNLPLTALFDRVLADVPCSGTGTLARNPEIKWRLKPEDLTDLQGRQVSILRSAMQRVSPGGRIVYSTCSLEKEENSEVVEAISADHSFRVLDCRIELERLRSQGELAWEGHRVANQRTVLANHPGGASLRWILRGNPGKNLAGAFHRFTRIGTGFMIRVDLRKSVAGP